jgi:two-component system CheB/CheR fusion protein
MVDQEESRDGRSPEPLVASRPAPALPVVGIGASAGGLRALRELFSTIPADTGLAYVVVVHLSPDRESHLAEILQPQAAIPVEQVTESTVLAPDRVYVIPPGRNLSAVDSHLRLSPIESGSRGRAPVDHFFRTLAETNDGSSIGIILSGTGTDGVNGIRHIRERGGLVLAQEPDETEYDGMARSAIATGFVDVVSPVADMLGHIRAFVGTSPRVPAVELAAHDEEPPDLLQNVLAVIRLRTGHDFLRYKRSTVARRIARRMQVLGVELVQDYLQMLRSEPHEANALLDDLLINVTSFFRDPAIFRSLESDVVPRLFEGKGPADRVRVWSVGCSTGEEAYSLGMLLLEEASRRRNAPQVQVFASDLHERSLRYAREALYPVAVEADIPAERLERFFHRDDGSYRVSKELRDCVVFASHNLLQDPPFSRLDLIVCRNVLIYLQSDLQREVVELFHYALNASGWLLLGTAETIDRADLFRLEDTESHLYRRRDARASELRLPARVGGALGLLRPDVLASPPPNVGAAGFGALHQAMVERYAPPSLLVDRQHEVVHLSQHVGRYLQHPGGSPTMNVFKLVREELRVELRAALHATAERGRGWLSRPIAVEIEGDTHEVVLRVSPVGDGEEEGLTLVIFDAVEAPEPASPADGDRPDATTVRELEAELELLRSRLEIVLEEFETSQEEMRASNEELQSSNEELRSTMEELETSREELQSINEELQTLNQENKHKVEELSQLSNDLQNLLQATDVATLFLDRNLRILRFTPRVSEIFNIRYSDRGRPLADLTHRLGYDGLMEDARRVLQSLVPVEHEVESRDGSQWYVVRVSPYRTREDRIEGVVITLIEVTAIKRSELALHESEARDRESGARFRAIVNLVPELLWQSGIDGSATWHNSRWCAYTGQTGTEASGWGWTDAIHPDDRDGIREAFASPASAGSVLRQEHRIRRADGVYRWFLVRAEPLHDEAGRNLGWFGAAIDVHEQRKALEDVERRVAERTSELARANHALEAAATEQIALRRQLASAEEEERRRLARELHDQLGQQLTAFLLGLEDATRLVGAHDGSRATADAPLMQRLGQLSELAQAMTLGARYLALELRPPELDDVGLESAIHTYAAQWSARYGVAVEVTVRSATDSALPPDVGTTLYRIVQEALTNIARHAGASQVSIVIQRSDEDVRVIIEDDGNGFDVESTLARARHERRLGIAGMRERAMLVGGSLSLESSPGAGTTVYVQLQLEAARDDRTPGRGSLAAS